MAIALCGPRWIAWQCSRRLQCCGWSGSSTTAISLGVFLPTALPAGATDRRSRAAARRLEVVEAFVPERSCQEFDEMRSLVNQVMK